MSIGERIVALRTERKMSQSDLAEALNVSRQSISKWETDSSVPELEKLVALCEIFGVSMDMLVRGIEAESASPHKEAEPAWTAPEAYTQEVVHVVKMETRKIAGVLLFVCAMLCIGTCTFLGDMIAGLLLALPFIVCGVICLACKKRAGLWCAWFVYMFAEIFLRFATGVSSGIVLAFLRGHIPMGVTVVIGFVELLLIAGLMAGTVWSFRDTDIRPAKNRNKWLAAGWITYLLLRVLLIAISSKLVMRAGYLIYIMAKDWVLFAMLVLLLIWTYHWHRERRSKKESY